MQKYNAGMQKMKKMPNINRFLDLSKLPASKYPVSNDSNACFAGANARCIEQFLDLIVTFLIRTGFFNLLLSFRQLTMNLSYINKEN